MSSILKALRKVEEEKRATAHVAPDLRSDQGRVERKGRPYLALVAGAALGVFCLGLVFLLAVDNEEPVAAPPEVVEQAKPLMPITQPPAREVVIPVVEMPPEPVAVQTSKRATAKKTVSLEENTGLAAKALDRKPAQQTKKPSRPEPETLSPPTQTMSPLPAGLSLNVMEIFYQQDNASSMALVNDLPVMVGTSIDGATVSEIHVDHVVFNIDGKSYSISSSSR